MPDTNTNTATEPTPARSGYAWLQELKADDKVIECTYEAGGRSGQSIKTVQKVTPTQIVLSNTRYKRTNGEEIGGGYHAGDIKEATPERIAFIEKAIQRRQAISTIRAVKWETLPTDFLLRILAMVEEETKKTNV